MKDPGGTDGNPFNPYGFPDRGRPSSDILIDGPREINKGSVARPNGRGNRELSEQDYKLDRLHHARAATH
jgi:hypothetical protein